MATASTPMKRVMKDDAIRIPPSPCLKKIGYGTGVAVYTFPRSPLHNQLRSPWAVKKLLMKEKNDLSKRMKIEANILQKLNHENVVGFRGYIESSNTLVMEECSTSLGDCIEKRYEAENTPFPAKYLEKVARDIANALNYLHNVAFILHCDVKSYNILIKGDFDVCKLCDFGVSLPLDKNGNVDKKDNTSDDDQAEYMGSVAWCSPEVLSFPQIITTKADVYAYGLVLWEMIALSPPPVEANSLDSLDLSEDDIEDEDNVVRKQRPDLPIDVELGNDYYFSLQLFFICTIEEYEKRPSAQQLCDIIKAV